MVDLKDAIIITFITKDKPGLVHQITSLLSKSNINIIDIDQTVVNQIFTIILICDLSTSHLHVKEAKKLIITGLDKLSKSAGGYFMMDEYKYPQHVVSSNKRAMKVTVIGKDAPGIVSGITGILAGLSINIESISMISRKEIFAMELLSSHDLPPSILQRVKQDLKRATREMDLSIIIQDKNVFSEEKKLVVFDMDSTLIQQECINELGRAMSVESKSRIAAITEAAMKGEMDFRDALRERVQLLKGMKKSVLEDIANGLTLTPGANELIGALKKMGYKVALISSGFTFFTAIVKRKLGLDYAFGNELLVKDGKLTGEFNQNLVIDAKQKAKIQRWIAQIEKIPKENIISIGDGANDAIMVENSGLGIGFRPKEIVRRVADGVINEDNMIGILFALGDLRRKKRRFIDFE